MLHGSGMHKEQWEPILEKLFALQSEKSTFYRIREAWLFDWQNHGESAVLNEEALKDDPKSAPLDLWGRSIAQFLMSGLVSGHRFVGIGYSLGAVGILLSTRGFDKCPYEGIILVEPCMTDEDTWATNRDELHTAFTILHNAIKHRRNVWASKREAHQYFLSRSPWNAWDPRIVALYVEHALKDSTDKNGKACVGRKCPTIHEASAFQANLELGGLQEAAERTSILSDRVPIHVIFGESVDLVPEVCRDCVVDRTKRKNAASITMIPDVGHSIIPQQPHVVSTTISQILNRICSAEAPVRSLL
ncbi:Alpha/beta hydrolase fold-1 [Mycena albidolilacea]|uniref:Alpha/beta hydrolase fold-1 n=1 Tax=Mycena albidolilacea TaxID=1033008 RepID=A0AAD7A6X3_9AGAR|nr:Alpha/beta hydrolase fold-1 [Mycena albidolilacea]